MVSVGGAYRGNRVVRVPLAIKTAAGGKKGAGMRLMAVRATARAGSGLLLRISEFYLPVRSVCTTFAKGNPKEGRTALSVQQCGTG